MSSRSFMIVKKAVPADVIFAHRGGRTQLILWLRAWPMAPAASATPAEQDRQ
jgi:hypothetical protein